MDTILIADAGSTKVEWTCVDASGNRLQSFRTEGVNALLSDQEALVQAFADARNALRRDLKPDRIYYYGAGCATPEICAKVAEAIGTIFNGAEIEVESDLVGAARGLLGNRKGIACILGTGSNSCLYDGKKIVNQIPSLGYVLGDEGSGAALGKRLLSDAFKMQLPDSIREKFLDKFGLTLPQILDRIYRSPRPNAFLASLVPFLNENLWNPYVYSLILEELTVFVKRNVAMYPGAHTAEICFTGSIAFNFQKILKEAAASQGFRVASVTETPVDGLVNYHKTVSA